MQYGKASKTRLSTYLSIFVLLFSFVLSLGAETNIDLLRKAEANHVESQVNLAIVESLTGKSANSHYWFRRAAKQNHPLACRMVGMNHFTGKGTSRNPDIGKRWLERAARLDDAESMLFLANHYHEENNTIEALAWTFVHLNKFGSSQLPDWTNSYPVEIKESARQMADEWLAMPKPAVHTVRPYERLVQEYLEFRLPNGDKYEGMTVKGIPHGQGKRLAKDGSSYLGEFKNGKENGYGTWFDSRGIIVRQGLWKNGNPIFSQ